MTRRTRNYPNEFKQEAVKLVLSSHTVSSVATELIPTAKRYIPGFTKPGKVAQAL